MLLYSTSNPSNKQAQMSENSQIRISFTSHGFSWINLCDLFARMGPPNEISSTPVAIDEFSKKAPPSRENWILCIGTSRVPFIVSLRFAHGASSVPCMGPTELYKEDLQKYQSRPSRRCLLVCPEWSLWTQIQKTAANGSHFFLVRCLEKYTYGGT